MDSIKSIYESAQMLAGNVIYQRVMLQSILTAVALLIGVFFGLRIFGAKKIGCASLIAVFLAVFGFIFVRGDINGKVDSWGHELANVAINQGVDTARKAQAAQEQYIHAIIVGFDTDRLDCHETVNSHDDCQNETGWYTHQEINVWYETVKDCDSDGKNCTSHQVRHWDDQYTPYFAYVLRYYVVPDTKAKYLDHTAYNMTWTDPNGHPKVFLHNDWRAPVDARSHTYNNRGAQWGWNWNERVPEYWTRVQKAAQEGGTPVVGNFVGPYFNWGVAAESVQFQVYDGQYKTLKTLVTLPGPNGRVFGYTDSYGHKNTLQTLLTGNDDDLALDFAPVTPVGVTLSQETLDALNRYTMTFQGYFGPNKEASARWFLVSDTIAAKMGGIINVTQALKAYLNDVSVWGNFRLPKNLVILVTQVSDDGKQITARDMETGMPTGMGNVLVEQRMRLSVTPDDPIPLTPENLFGKFTASYVKTTDTTLTYVFSDMHQAGAIIGLLYEETPGWQPPDPNSDTCTTAPAEHLGFVRHSMCTEAYLESTIKVNTEGVALIMAGVEDGANGKTPLLFYIVLLFGSLGVAGVDLYYENRNSTSFR